jgi:thioredoxin reductase
MLIVEMHVPGGQAGTSSRIENYPGFPAESAAASSPAGHTNKRSAQRRHPYAGQPVVIVGSSPTSRHDGGG